MDAKKIVEKALKPIENAALGIYLYGSHADGTQNDRSDIDVCVVAGMKVQELYRQTSIIMAKNRKLDIKLFEELPLYIKKRVMEKGILLHSSNKKELDMYLRFYRKLWNEQAAVRLGYEKAIA